MCVIFPLLVLFYFLYDFELLSNGLSFLPEGLLIAFLAEQAY